MNSEDFWSGLGAIGSTLISIFSWIYNLGVLQALFPFIAGAFVTYFVQSKLQDRSEKRKLRITYIEKFHIPLFLEIESIKEKLFLNLIDAGGVLHSLLKQPEIFTLKFELRNQLQDFLEKQKIIARKKASTQKIASRIIFENFRNQLLPAILKRGVINLETEIKGEIAKWEAGSSFSLQRTNPHETATAPIANCAILGKNPIDLLEENKSLESDQIILSFKIHYKVKGGIITKDFRIPLKEFADPFSDYWKRTLEDSQKNNDIKKFNNLRLSLIPTADNITKRLKKHIERYVTQEEI